MELLTKQGFKQTEVGLIPMDWHIKKVGDLTLTSAGGTPSTKNLNYWGGQIPWMNSGELNLKRVEDVENRITNEGLINSSTKYIPKFSVLIGLAGQGKTRGTAAINLIKLCTNQSIGAIYPSKHHDSFFLYYYIDSLYNELRKLSTGDGGRGGLNLNIIRNIKIPLPPTLKEQKAIATALSDVDDLIASLESLIAKKQAIKQGAMQQLLTPPQKGGKRLPGFSGEWVEKKLGEFSNCIRGVSYNGSQDLYTHDNDDSVRLLRSNNVYDKKIVFEDLQFVKQGKVNSHQILIEKDILICMANGSKALVGKAGQFHGADDKYTFGAFMGVLRPIKQKCNSDFIYHLFSSFDFRCHLDVLLSGSSINNLRPSDIESFSFYSPEIEEQNAIAKILSDMDAEIEQLETKKAKYQQVKQGMMQELLTGKTRLV